MQRRRPTLTKAELVARLPRLMRPKLDRAQVRDLALCHALALDDIAKGIADEVRLWDWVGGVLTWHHTAHALGVLTAEMTAVGEMAHRLIQRFEQTGRVGFSGPDYQLAKDAVAWMDELAEITDQPTAAKAAEWSERTVQALADQCFARRQAANAGAELTAVQKQPNPPPAGRRPKPPPRPPASPTGGHQGSHEFHQHQPHGATAPPLERHL